MIAAKKSYLQNDGGDRTIFLVDMNSYFATCEQMSNPALRGKPIGVGGSNLERTVITAASYEAKRTGIKNGMNVFEAKRLCPNLIVVVGDPEKYVDTTMRFLKIFQEYTPDLEIFSIDEAFLDVTRTHRRFGGPVQVAKDIKQKIRRDIGSLFTCSVGISYNKTMAKLAAGKMKPDGLVWIKREVTKEDRKRFADALNGTGGKMFSTEEALSSSQLTDLCGIGSRIENGLLNMGIASIPSLAKLPVERLKRRFGVYGIFLHHIANGEDPSPVVPFWQEDPYRSMGHNYTIPKDVNTREELEPLMLKLSEKIGRRLRSHGYKGRTVHLTLRGKSFLDYSQQHSLPFYINDGFEIYKAACRILDGWSLTEPIRMVGVSLSGLVKNYHQLSLFEHELKRERLIEALDKINDRYGEFTILRSRILDTKLKIHVGGFLEDRGTAFKSFGVKVKK